MRLFRTLILGGALAASAVVGGVALDAGASVPAHTHCTPPDNPLREKDCPPPPSTEPTTTTVPVTTTTTTVPPAPPTVTPPPPPTPIPVPPHTAG